MATSSTGRILYKIADTVIVILCLPFYAVLFPLALLYEVISVRVRKVYLGLHVQHWYARNIREEFRVVDVSRLMEGFVGVQRRMRACGDAPPPFPENIEYCSLREFWLGRSRLLR